jgi:sugar phosphate isomerase/epimerase
MSHPAYSRAFSTLGCTGLPLQEAIRLADDYKLDAIELRGLGGSLNVPAYLEQAFGTPENFAATARQSSIRVCAMDTSLHLIGNTADARAEFLRFIPWAEALGVPRLRVFDGGIALNDAGLEQALETLSWWQELRRTHGWRVDLMIETHYALTRTPAILRFLEQAPAGASILWDTHHTWRLGNETPVDTWRAIRASVVHIHVRDSVSIPSGRHACTYVLPGQGEFDMSGLREALGRDAYTGTVSLEWERHWHPELPPLEQVLAAAHASQWW